MLSVVPLRQQEIHHYKPRRRLSTLPPPPKRRPPWPHSVTLSKPCQTPHLNFTGSQKPRPVHCICMRGSPYPVIHTGRGPRFRGASMQALAPLCWVSAAQVGPHASGFSLTSSLWLPTWAPSPFPAHQNDSSPTPPVQPSALRALFTHKTCNWVEVYFFQIEI